MRTYYNKQQHATRIRTYYNKQQHATLSETELSTICNPNMDLKKETTSNRKDLSAVSNNKQPEKGVSIACNRKVTEQ